MILWTSSQEKGAYKRGKSPVEGHTSFQKKTSKKTAV